MIVMYNILLTLQHYVTIPLTSGTVFCITYQYNRIIEKLATQRSVAEKTKAFSIAGLLKDKGVYENRRFFY